MLPALATMIGAYIIFRMIETLFLATTRYSGRTQHVVVGILAGLVGVVVLVQMIEVWIAGTRSSGTP